jgi:hypothetical protein
MRNVFYLFIIIFLFGCKKTDTVTPTPVEETHMIVAADGKTPISRALVFVADGATIFYTYTDKDGNFVLRAPAGPHELNIQSGGGAMFRTAINITVPASDTVVLPTSSVRLNQVANFAYVPGSFDRIEDILTGIGYSATSITTSAFTEINNISQYNAIFINCSYIPAFTAAQDQALADYVSNGGSMYVSDYGLNSLLGYSDDTYHCGTARPGGFLNDNLLCTEKKGGQGLVSAARIVSPELQTYLNKSTMDIKYNLPGWETVKSYDHTFWEVLVDSVGISPLLLRTNKFTNVSAGTIHIGPTNNMVTICHIPPGDPTHPITITIDQSAVAAHLAHGDNLGSCANPTHSGRIYFTTFHNEPNETIGTDVRNILQYMILNL